MPTERAWRQTELGEKESVETEHGDRDNMETVRESMETERAAWRQREYGDRDSMQTERGRERERACLVDRESIHTERYAMLTGRTPRQREHGAHGDRPRERANYCIYTHTFSISWQRNASFSVPMHPATRITCWCSSAGLLTLQRESICSCFSASVRYRNRACRPAGVLRDVGQY